MFAREFGWAPDVTGALYLTESLQLEARLRAELLARDDVFLPIEETKGQPATFETLTVGGVEYIKIPRRILDDYLQTKRTAEIVWAVLSGSPKTKSVKYDGIVPDAPWQKQIDTERWRIGREAARRLREEAKNGDG